MTRRYKANYDQIARDHIRHWRITGRNPFQNESVIAHNEADTLLMIQRWAKPGDLILDAGCGMGDLLLRLGDYQAVGIDLSTDYIEIAKERGLDARVGRVEKLPWPREQFDVVVCADVLEHVLDLNKAVRELLRVLKPGGTLVVRTPNQEALAVDTEPYEYVHLRRFDHPTMHLLFRKIFDCEILETIEDPEVIHVAVRK
jgi:2-polyprenyl-3-methyl-5-hydroxy-6-metoxy-1,4-benzoquinol methylase